MSYRSKVDWWLAALLAGGLLGPPIAILFIAGAEESGTVILITAISILVVFPLVFPVRYTIAETELRIRSGMFVRKVPYERIRQVYPTRSPWSAAAWSLDRLRIDLDDAGFILISPVSKDAFITKLAVRSGLRKTGQRLVCQDASGIGQPKA